MYKLWLENHARETGITCEIQYMTVDELRDMDRRCLVCMEALCDIGGGKDPSERQRIAKAKLERARLEALGLHPVAVPLPVTPTTEIIYTQHQQTGKLRGNLYTQKFTLTIVYTEMSFLNFSIYTYRNAFFKFP
jgi:hypothetical protein